MSLSRIHPPVLHLGNAGPDEGVVQDRSKLLPGKTLLLSSPPVEPFKDIGSDPPDKAVERKNVPVDAVVVVVAQQPDVETPEEFLTGQMPVFSGATSRVNVPSLLGSAR